MTQIKSKVYYLITTGEVLTVTSEMQGCVEETTKEQDMEVYPQLKDKNIDEVNFIELEYGTLVTTFNNAKTYKVSLETKQLEVIYYTQEEIESMQNENQETQDLNSRVSDISQYLSGNQTTIADVEDLIIQTEQNKILNSEGMM